MTDKDWVTARYRETGLGPGEVCLSVFDGGDTGEPERLTPEEVRDLITNAAQE